MDWRNPSRSAVSFALSASALAESASMTFASAACSSSELSTSLLTSFLMPTFTSFPCLLLTGALLLFFWIQNLNFTQRFAEKLGHVSHRGHGALVVHARGAEDAERTLHEVVAHVSGADERKVVTRLRNLLDADQHVNGLGRVDACV